MTLHDVGNATVRRFILDMLAPRQGKTPAAVARMAGAAASLVTFLQARGSSCFSFFQCKFTIFI